MADLNIAQNAGVLLANSCAQNAHKRSTSFCELVKIGKAHPDSVHKPITGDSLGFWTEKQLRHVQSKDVVLPNAVAALLSKHGEAAGSAAGSAGGPGVTQRTEIFQDSPRSSTSSCSRPRL